MNFKRFHESKNLLATLTENYAIDASGNINSNNSFMYYTAPCEANETYTFSLDSGLSGSTVRIHAFNGDTWIEQLSGRNINLAPFTITTPANTTNLKISITKDAKTYHTMLNDGETALPYEPYSSEVWHDIPYYIRGTSTDTLTLPADIYADGSNATVNLKGNTEQSGTPSPSAPVMPNGVGDMSSNLCEDFVSTSYGGSLISASGIVEASGAYKVWYAKVTAGETYTISRFNSVYAFYANKPIEGSTSTDGERHFAGDVQSYTLTIPSGVGYLAVRTNFDGDIPMINSGSSPLPYEPYGQYKIPILNNSQTTNVYLGEVQTVRLIKKLVLDGTEGWQRTSNGAYYLSAQFCPTDYLRQFGVNISICSHFPTEKTKTGSSAVSNGYLTFYASEIPITYELYIAARDIATLTEFTNFLSNQYSAGTPVTIWYVLATSTTGITNEPLMKIGNYADTLSTSISTTDGANSLSVDTQVQPSEVSANYHGWHPVGNVHEYGENKFDITWYANKTGITVDGETASGTCGSFYSAKIAIPSELVGKTVEWSAYIKRTGSTDWVHLQTVDNGSYIAGTNVNGEGTSTVSFTATATMQLYVNYNGSGTDTIALSDIKLTAQQWD